MYSDIIWIFENSDSFLLIKNHHHFEKCVLPHFGNSEISRERSIGSNTIICTNFGFKRSRPGTCQHLKGAKSSL